jgi:hypothetical protein
MPTPTISAYLTRAGNDGLREVIQIFRHDFVQYMGMILSWVTLIEAEAAAVPDADVAFRAAAAQLQGDTERIFNEASVRLRPDIPDNGDAAQLNLFWETFFSGFSADTVPTLAALETQTLALVRQPAFGALIESSLGAVAEGDSIGGLLLRPFERLRAMFQPAIFDARVAEVVNSRHHHDALPPTA